MTSTGGVTQAPFGDPESGKKWLAVFTAPRHEKKVAQHLALRGIENFLPLYRTPREWKDGSKGFVELPLFSNYIFVRVGCGGRASVLCVPGVIYIVGCGHQTLAIPDTYVRWLREGLRQEKIHVHPQVAVGTRVRIRSGLMTDMEGVLLRTKSSLRVVVTLEAIMKSVTVEVDMSEIEPVDGSSGELTSDVA